MNRKSILTLLTVVALAASIFTPAFAAPAPPAVWTENVLGVTAGSTVVVPVKIDAGSAKLLGWGFDLAWDPAVLELTSWSEGSFVKDQAVAAGGDSFRVAGSINNGAGTLVGAAVAALGFPTGQGATGAGIIANLTFKAKSDGKATLVFSNTEMRDQNNALATYAFEGGFVRVGASPMLVVESIAFTPASGAMSTTAAVTIKNNGAAMAAGDETVVTLAMNHASPASQTFTVSGLSVGGTQVLTQAYDVTAGQTATRLTVSDSVYGISTGADYFASVSDSKQTDVDAKFDTFIQLTTDGQVQFYPLALGNNQEYAGMNILSNAQMWQVGAAANPNDWRMAEWTGSAFKPSGFKLNDPLKVFAFKGASERGRVDGGADGLLVPDGKVADQTLDAGESFSLTYAQFLHSGDAALTAPNTYHATLTYTAAVSF